MGRRGRWRVAGFKEVEKNKNKNFQNLSRQETPKIEEEGSFRYLVAPYSKSMKCTNKKQHVLLYIVILYHIMGLLPG